MALKKEKKNPSKNHVNALPASPLNFNPSSTSTTTPARCQ
jgi:hypothetical protein